MPRFADCAAVCLLLLLFAGCQERRPAPRVRDGDPALFTSEVQPILETHCAFLGCHGREGMPLTVYALNYQRRRDPDGLADPTRPLLDERALSLGEMEYNRQALAARVGMDTPDEDIERFVRRLLSPEQGGIRHAGVVVFERPDDPALDALRRFLRTVR